MLRPACRRLSVVLATVATTAVLGAVAAPGASADPVHPGMPDVSHSRGVAPGVIAVVPPFGRRLG